MPRVSVGVPVYNGGRYLARAIESILGQTFGRFELIIADNGSTDETESICSGCAARDPRVRYVRSETNMGIVRNFNRCAEMARGEYFKWCAADDMCAPTLLERCVAVLDADPSVVLAFAKTQLIDADDRPIRVNEYDADADDPRPHVRFSRLINLDHRRHWAQEVYGVMRRSALLSTPLYEPYVRTDSILLARLALLGRFRRVDEPLFLNREHERRSVEQVPGRSNGAAPRSRVSRWLGPGPVPSAEFWDPSVKGKISYPEWRILREYARSLLLAPLSDRERAMCWWVLSRFTFQHLPKLARDLIIASELHCLGPPRLKTT